MGGEQKKARGSKGSKGKLEPDSYAECYPG